MTALFYAPNGVNGWRDSPKYSILAMKIILISFFGVIS